MRRWVVLIASVLIQLCLGVTYAWSVFAFALNRTYGLTSSETQCIFGCTVAVFALAMVGAGRLQDRKGPRVVALIGAVLFGAGYFIASRSGGSFIWLLLGVGIVSGTGIGFGYVCPLASCMKWFPSHKGLITGIAVAGVGGSALLLTWWAEWLLGRGVDVLEVFQSIAIVYGAILVLCSFCLSVPSDSRNGQVESLPFRAILSRRLFWGLSAGMFAGTFAGLLVIGNLKPMGVAAGLSAAVASSGIGFFAVGNSVGRILWGKIYDRIGALSIPLSLVFLGVCTSGLLFSGPNGAAYLTLCLLIGLGFSACFVLYATHTASAFGSDMLGRVYPLVFLFYGASALIGPPLGGCCLDMMQSFHIPVLVASPLGGVGALVWWRMAGKPARSM